MNIFLLQRPKTHNDKIEEVTTVSLRLLLGITINLGFYRKNGMKRLIQSLLLSFISTISYAQDGVFKEIVFREGYTISGYVVKKTFPAQNNISITWGDTASMRGELYYDANGAVVKGLYHNAEGEIEGTFFLWNNKKKKLVAKSKLPLKWELLTISRYSTTFGDYSATLNISAGQAHLSLINKNEGKTIKSIDADIQQELLNLYGFRAIESLIRNSGTVRIKYNDSQEFYGNVIWSPDFHKHTALSGTIKGVPARNVKEIKFKKEENSNTNIEVLMSEGNDIHNIQYTIPSNMVAEEGNGIYKSLFPNTQTIQGKAIMLSQRSFEGNLTVNVENGQFNILLKDGTVFYDSGDKFVGNAGGKSVCGIPIEGVTYFSNGTKKSGNWLSNMKLTEYDKERLQQLNSLSEINEEAQEMSRHNSTLKVFTGEIIGGPSGYYCSGRSLETIDGNGSYKYYVEDGERTLHGSYSFNYSLYISYSGKDKITVTGNNYDGAQEGNWRFVHKSSSGSIVADLNEVYKEGKLSGPFTYVLTSDEMRYKIVGQYIDNHFVGNVKINFSEGRNGFEVSGRFDDEGWADGEWVLTDKKTKDKTKYYYSMGSLTNKSGSSKVSISAIFKDKYEPLSQYKKIIKAFK